eukprot:CAMPEP_0172165172 /NCGR_PEP_ID=MMETSP1050-20130122/8266_1 /TAXON_ID=233186 /ORGANISM="Cryptomonas curvata, Strain CCAP979/52" /LENGTH=38 /DNA_ID= /DNA_START= /DNA_END= /DNA_ORIENTATION=
MLDCEFSIQQCMDHTVAAGMQHAAAVQDKSLRKLRLES